MKRIIYLVALFFIIFFMFSVQVSAAETYIGPDGNEYEYKYLVPNNERTGYAQYVYSHYPFGYISVNPNSGWYKLVTIAEYEDELYLGYITTNANSYNADFTGLYPSAIIQHNWQVEKQDGTKPIYNWTITLPPDLIDLPIYESYSDAFEALSYVEKEYFYDASIPKAGFSVYVNGFPSWTAIEEETSFLSLAFDTSNDYKIEIGYYYYSPSYVSIGLNNGNVTYSPVQFYKSPYMQAYLGDANNALLLNNIDIIWDSYITDNDSTYFTTTVPIWQNTWNNGAYDKARQNWINKYGLVMPYYGNKIEIMARYYVETSDSIYVGPWNRWINTYPNTYTEQIPSNYQVGTFVPGIQSQANEVEVPEEEFVVGEVTGPIGSGNGTNITINQAVPNYPDYPTIASYNHDNVLLTFMDTATRLPGTFSGFTSFLTSAFGFIPSSIWSVIGFGLTCCIVVMIIKIL